MRPGYTNNLGGRGIRCRCALTLALCGLGAGQVAVGGEPPARQGPPWAAALDQYRQLSRADQQRLLDQAGLRNPVTAKVDRGVLTLNVVERGTLEAVRSRDIVNVLRARTKDSPIATTIKWVIDDGAIVKKGDKLIELDDSQLQGERKQRKIDVDQAEVAFVKAEENQKLLQKEMVIDVRLGEIAVEVAASKRKRNKDPDFQEELELQVEKARLELERLKARAAPKLAEARAELQAKKSVVAAAMARWSAVEQELAKCILHAPQDGVVIYYVPEQARFGTGRPSIVAQGEPVREGQKLLQIPDLSQMQVSVRVHEALVSYLRNEDPQDQRKRQPARIRVDAFPNRILQGHVRTVNAVAGTLDFFAADVKVYGTMVAIDTPAGGLKPGMSAEVTILARQTAGPVLHVPVQAVLTLGKKRVCFVRKDKGLQDRAVVTGLSNDQAVEIKSGLEEGDQILLSPRALARRLAPLLDRKGPQAPGSDQSRRRGPTPILVRSVKPADTGAARRSWIAAYGLTAVDRQRMAALPGVVDAVPVRGFPQEVRHLLRSHFGQVVATNPEYLEVNHLRVAAGRFLCAEDEVNRRNVVVLGASVAEWLFPGQGALGQTVVLYKGVYVVVGVLNDQDERVRGAEAFPANNSTYLPLGTCNARFGARVLAPAAGGRTAEEVPLSAILVIVRDPATMSATADAIQDLLRLAHSRLDWIVQGPPGP